MSGGFLGAALTAGLSLAAGAGSLFPALAPGLLPLLLLGFSALACAGAGRSLVSALGVGGLNEEEKTTAGATLGLGILALGTFALGVLGGYRPWAGSLLLGALWLCAWPQIRPTLSSAREGLRRARQRPWLCTLIGLPLLAALWACWVPPHQYDALVYHLALPQDYVRAGRLYAPPGLLFAHFPQNGEMLYTLSLLLSSDLLAQMFTWLAAVLSVVWLLSFGRRLSPAAPWAAVLIATHTAVLLLCSTAYVEPLVMLWLTAGVLTFEIVSDRHGGLILSAVFIGLALGTKYYAGLAAAVLFLRLLFRRRYRDALSFAAVVVVLFLPWLIKNSIFVGNPVFPFLYRLFPATSVGWTGDLARGYFQVLTEYGHARGFWKDLAALPVLLFRNPLRYGGGMDVLGDLGWDLLLWLWPLGLWAAWRRRAPRGPAVFTILYIAGWFCTGVVLRFLTAVAPLMALVAAAGAADWRGRASAGARLIFQSAAALLIAAHFFLALYVHGVFGSSSALLALESRQEFLSKRLDYYPCASFARGLEPKADILVVGEQRGYYIPREHRPSTVHAPNLYIQLADQSSSPLELARALRSSGFTHLLFVPRELERLGPGLGFFTSRGEANWDGLAPFLSVLYRGPACVLAALEAPRR